MFMDDAAVEAFDSKIDCGRRDLATSQKRMFWDRGVAPVPVLLALLWFLDNSADRLSSAEARSLALSIAM
jgi:hypothetical protein